MQRTLTTLSLALLIGCTAHGQDNQAPATSPAPAPKAAQAAASDSPGPAAAPSVALPRSIAGTSGTLTRFELADRIVEREPEGIATTFSRAAAPRIFAFVEIGNKHGEPFELEVRFDRLESTTPGRGFKLAIPSAERWRTQAITSPRKPGRYRAVIVAPDGTEVAAREFVVTE